jgi:Uma2 family endonuclease
VYDRDFKRENYLRLGVQEVWLVDQEERTIEVSRRDGGREIVRDVVVWRPPTPELEVRVELGSIFPRE